MGQVGTWETWRCSAAPQAWGALILNTFPTPRPDNFEVPEEAVTGATLLVIL